MRNATKHGYNFGSIVKGILAANAIRGGIGMVTNGVQKVVGDFLDFDDTMVSAASKFDDVGIKAEDFGGKLQKLKEDWRAFAVGTRYSAADLAKSAEAFAEAGWNAVTAKGVTPYLIKAATAAREKDIADFTNVSVGLMQGFNLKTGDANTDTKNFVTLLDQITQGAVDAIGGIKDLKESLKVLAPVWQESETTAATIAFASTLQNAGFPGDMVATAGKNAKLRLARPDIVQGLKLSGIDVKDPNTGRVKAVVNLYEEIAAKMKKVGIKPGSPEDIAINTALFGSYALAGNKSMLQHLGAYRAEIERIQTKSKNVAGDTADAINQYSTMSKVLMLVGTVTEKAFTVLEAFNGKGQKGIEGLTERIKNFDAAPLISGMKSAGAVIGLAWDVLSPFLPALPWIVAGWWAWNAALKVFAAFKFAGVIWQIGQAMIAGLGACGALETAMASLWVAMAPMVTGVLAIAAIGGIGAALYSGVTGKDNFISQIAQNLGIVPKLSHDSEGHVIGYADEAPNSKEAEARRIQFNGQLNIAGAPPGSTFSSSVLGAPNFSANLGPQPVPAGGR